VDELYWFRFLQQGTDAYGVFFAGQVTRVAPKTVFWNWCLERTPAQRSINALCDEGTEKLTESECDLIGNRPELYREETRQALQDQPPRLDRPLQQPSERPAAEEEEESLLP
jgi:hypothetical protein